MEGQEGAGEIGELLKSAVEFVSQPLAEAKLHKHKKAPCEHGRKNCRWFTLEEFGPHQRNNGEGEREEFGDGEQPERSCQPREAAEKGFAKFAWKPRGHSVRHFADAGEAPDANEEEVGREQCSGTGNPRQEEVHIPENVVMLSGWKVPSF